jgi:hypothetical protein
MKPLTIRDRRELRFFALGLAALLVIAFWWWIPWLRERPQPLWPLLVAWVLVMMAWAYPPSVYPVYRLLLPVSRLLGWINTWLLLGTVFFAILLPLGWLLRRSGKLQYVTGFDRTKASYRVPVSKDHETNLREPF